MSRHDAAVAAIRFGLGARPGEIAARTDAPRESLIAELSRPTKRSPQFAGRPSAEKLIARFMRERDRDGDRAVMRLLRKDFRQVLIEEARLRTEAALTTPSPFTERLVYFWSNHFTVSAKRPILAGLAGAFEREAIRPNLSGRFEDLLIAVTRHPAMLLYLDNVLSNGPNSMMGQRGKRGMNENLAREILELHTLGVGGGYEQADVVELARMLTGWSIARPGNSGRPGRFRFYAAAHEPGDRVMLSRTYEEDGQAQAEHALRALARHPATIQHLATKLVRHFTRDDPNPADVAKIMAAWLTSEGDLTAVHRALVDLESAWRPLTKLKTPNELLISSLRAAGHDRAQRWVVPALHLLGQAPWTAPSPKGWDDTAAAWLGASQVLRRIEFASAWIERGRNRLSASRFAGSALGPLADRHLERVMADANDDAQALAVAMTTPAFQRR